jgi:hypothetical protein
MHETLHALLWRSSPSLMVLNYSPLINAMRGHNIY